MVEVRPIEERDIAGFRDALDSVARDTGFLRSDAAPPMEGVAAFVRGNIAAGHPQFVAVADGRVVGWCDIIPADALHERHGGEMGMGVVAEWRGKGIGRALLTRTIAAADAAGLLRIGLSVHADNPRAIALYRQCGFVEEGRQIKARLKQGVAVDIIMMARLRPADEWPKA